MDEGKLETIHHFANHQYIIENPALAGRFCRTKFRIVFYINDVRLKTCEFKLIHCRTFGTFLEVAITLVDLLFIEHMLHLAHVKQMYCQPINLTYELIFCKQITRRRVDFIGDFALKILAYTMF